jgi:DNA-binding NarL/FixJ family response regulator
METKSGLNRPRLVVADDHTLILHGMRRLLESEFDIVGSVQDGRALLRMVQEKQPDLVLLDISMPLLNGIDAARQISRMRPNTKIVFLTMHDDPDYVREAFRAGASGYLLKSSAEEELAPAIRLVLRGRSYVAQHLSSEFQKLPAGRTRSPAKDNGGLSTREREVLQLVAEGRSAKEVADILCLSTKTVEYHKYRMMKKLGLHTAAELALYAARKSLMGLAPPSDVVPREPTPED